MLSDQNRVGRFIRFHTTNGALVKALATDADLSAVMEPTRRRMIEYLYLHGPCQVGTLAHASTSRSAASVTTCGCWSG